jgi:asparagine synthase (glutamine-hydrolysing)
LSAGDPAARYGRAVSYFQPWEKADIRSPEFAREVGRFDPYSLVRQVWNADPGVGVVNRLLASDVALYLPGDLLPKVDITTMAVSLEARSPLLDHVFMEWAAALPGDLKVRGGTTKYLFKQALAPWLPHDIIHRQKMGFAIPRNEWLRGPLRPMVHDLLLSPTARIGYYLNRPIIDWWVRRNDTFGSAGPQVWALLMLELWHREVQEAR